MNLFWTSVVLGSLSSSTSNLKRCLTLSPIQKDLEHLTGVSSDRCLLQPCWQESILRRERQRERERERERERAAQLPDFNRSPVRNYTLYARNTQHASAHDDTLTLPQVQTFSYKPYNYKNFRISQTHPYTLFLMESMPVKV